MSDALNQQALARSLGNAARGYHATVAQILDFWRGVHLAGLRQYLADTFNDPKNMRDVLTAVNLTGAVARKMAMAYSPGPKRFVTDASPEQSSAYGELLADVEWDERMASANAISFLVGVAAVRLAFTAAGRVALHVDPPHLWRGLCEADDPTRLTAYFYTVRNPQAGGEAFITVAWTGEYQYWLAGNHLDNPLAVLDQFTTLDAVDFRRTGGRVENAYGQIPVVLVYDRASATLKPPVDDVLLSLQLAVNLAATGGALNLKHQGFTQWVSRNFQASETVGTWLTGPDKFLDLGYSTGDGQPEIYTISPDPKTNEHVAWVDELWQLAARTYDIHPAVLRGDVNAPSGVALALMQAPLYQNQRRQQNRFNAYESRLFALLKTILQVEPVGWELPMDSRLLLDWPEPMLIHDPLEKWELAKAQMDAGLLSPVEFLQAQNPDMSQAEAVERLQRIRADLAQFPAQEIALPELGI